MYEFPAFEARVPWWGPDLQTLRNFLRGPKLAPREAASERLVLPLSDDSGDVLVGELEQPPEVSGRALVVLVHGLSGSQESAYMETSSAWLLARGHPVLRLNLRGAGPSRPLCRLQYHAGRTPDLRDALAALPGALAAQGIVLVGYSLGGNLVLKFLAEYGADFPVKAAASVSAPIDLAAASRRFLHRRNAVYHWHMLRRLKEESLGPGAELSEGERRAVCEARTLWEFDDRFVARRNGFADAEDYYRRSMALRFLHEIRIPTLVVHARDDPWIPAEAYTGFPWRENPWLVPLLPDGGGHVGFHARGGAAPWYDRCLVAFLQSRGL